MCDSPANGRRWLLDGRVQGVGFRWYVLKVARAADLDGTVRNLMDGRVEVVARGDGQTLDRLDERLRRGPALARVTDVVVEPAVVDENTDGFHVIY